MSKECWHSVYAVLRRECGSGEQVVTNHAAEDRPTYIGIASLAQVPFACAAPVVGGVIADRLGYGAVFVLTVLLGLAGAAMVVKKVRDPRHAAAVTTPTPDLPARAGARRDK